jgi:hypothetical protein
MGDYRIELVIVRRMGAGRLLRALRRALVPALLGRITSTGVRAPARFDDRTTTAGRPMHSL